MTDNIKKEPFRMYRGEEEIKKDREKTWTMTVRYNAKEKQMIEQAKNQLHLKNDSTALKTLARIGQNVLHSTFSPEILAYLTDPSRRREEK